MDHLNSNHIIVYIYIITPTPMGLLTRTPTTMSGGQVNTYPWHAFTKFNEKLMFDGLFKMQTILLYTYILLLWLRWDSTPHRNSRDDVWWSSEHLSTTCIYKIKWKTDVWWII